MIRLFFKENVLPAEEHEVGRALLEKALGRSPAVKIRPGGKPYLERDPVYFNLSHSGGTVGYRAAGDRF